LKEFKVNIPEEAIEEINPMVPDLSAAMPAPVQEPLVEPKIPDNPQLKTDNRGKLKFDKESLKIDRSALMDQKVTLEEPLDQVVNRKPARDSAPPSPSTSAPLSVDPQMIEKIVRNHTQKVIEKIVQKLVPEIAANLIKKEIDRLLDEDDL